MGYIFPLKGPLLLMLPKGSYVLFTPLTVLLVDSSITFREHAALSRFPWQYPISPPFWPHMECHIPIQRPSMVVKISVFNSMGASSVGHDLSWLNNWQRTCAFGRRKGCTRYRLTSRSDLYQTAREGSTLDCSCFQPGPG